ncbi:MAG: SemiSWEET transporter [Variibacter sp.]|nr:SemiSWEET transporter [Variibacter sp.]
MDISPVVVEGVGSAAAILTTVCWLPQALHVIRRRDTRAISFWSYFVFALGVALWLLYGVFLGRVPIVAANAITLTLLLVILAMKIRYG